MYCPNCKNDVEAGEYCPVCSHRLPNNGGINNAVPKPKFNYSKPLCLVFAAVLLFTMLMPWAHFVIPFAGALDMSVFSVQPRFSEIVDKVSLYAPLAGVNAQQLESTVWTINGILLLITAFFMLTALNFILFGVVGVFGKGRARYFFARTGCAMYIIGSCLFIAAMIVGSGYIKNRLGGTLSGFGINVTLGLTAWPFISLVLTVLFRTLGMRALRYFNGIRCLNQGYRDIAARELKKINKLEYLKPAGRRRYAKPAAEYSSED